MRGCRQSYLKRLAYLFLQMKHSFSIVFPLHPYDFWENKQSDSSYPKNRSPSAIVNVELSTLKLCKSMTSVPGSNASVEGGRV